MRIGTRGSALALAQAGHVAEQLRIVLQGKVELVTITTSGDGSGTAARVEVGAGPRVAGAGDHGAPDAPDAPRAPGAPGAPADKSRWVDTIEAALLAGEIDLAVHSAKDVPGELAAGLSLLGAPARASAEDVLCGAASLEALPAGASVGTSSVRRTAQLRAAREDLRVVSIAGNVDTRLRRLGEAHGEGGLQAIVLARAGLQRLGREGEVGGVLDPVRFVPAPGQGVLALEGRSGDTRIAEAVRAITDAGAFACLTAERALARELDASCHTPLGAHALPAGGGRLILRAWVGLPDGSAWCSDELAETAGAEGARLPASVGDYHAPEQLGREVAQRMKAAGAEELLRKAEEMAVEHA